MGEVARKQLDSEEPSKAMYLISDPSLDLAFDLRRENSSYQCRFQAAKLCT